MRMKYAAFAALLLMSASASVNAATGKPEPLGEAITSPVLACSGSKNVRVPVIGWGADMATSFANGNALRTGTGSIFAQKGLDMTLYAQNDFKKQVEDYLACRTPYLRGTMGMIAHTMDVLSRDARTAPHVFYKLSNSSGGDAVVGRENIKSPKDLKGKTIAVQAYGPHVDYLFKILADSGLTPADVTIRWTKELMRESANADSPMNVLLKDKTVDAAFVIIPEALDLTSGGTVGQKDTESTCKGCSILLSTKTADNVIIDVYAVRKDYLETHRAEVAAFTSGILLAQEKVTAIMKKGKKDPEYQQMIKASASLILGSAAGPSLDNMAGMWSDQVSVGYPGNIKFFEDASNPRSFGKMATELQNSLVAFGLLSKRVDMQDAGWDYKALAAGLTATEVVEAPRFEKQAVQQLAEKRMQQNVKQEGVLFEFEVYFGPNQNEFPADQYKVAFEKVISLASAYGGAIMTIEGHSDPMAYLRQKKSGASPMVLDTQRQSAKNLSVTRANALRESLVKYAQSKGVTLDASQFGVVGYGVSQPNTPNCTHTGGDIDFNCAPTEQQWAATRRVTFKLIQIEAETSAFKAL